MWTELIGTQDVVIVAVVSLFCALVALGAVGYFARRPAEKTVTIALEDISFVFRNEVLVDASESARRLIDLAAPARTDFVRVIRFFAPRFPTLLSDADQLKARSTLKLTSVDGLSTLHIERLDGSSRLTVEDAIQDERANNCMAQSAYAVVDALRMYRGLADGLPFPMWRQSANGSITWANEDYRRLERLHQHKDDDRRLPPSDIFKIEVDPAGDGHRGQRVKLDLPNEAEPRWYEFEISWVRDEVFVVALPVDRVVLAEQNLSSFVQTLTQTFAHLNVGLAVFNRKRELAIFNPALTDLMDLSPEFLVTRPSLFQVFDQLRDQRMVPEPKNYKSWHRKMNALEAAAADSVHSETWSLVDGRTFRVTGRPHPEGAIAFLFEDISDEILTERRIRADLQLVHTVIDGLEEAIGVFSPSGALALSNRAYRRLWHNGEDVEDGSLSFVEATRAWQLKCMPTPVWGDARDFAATMGERSNWTADVVSNDGKTLECRFDALAGGFTLAGFRHVPPVVLPASKRTSERMTA